MASRVPDAVYDYLLTYIAANGVRMDVCNGEPTSYSDATVTKSLGFKTFAGGVGSPNYTLANGPTSGRKLVVAEQSGMTINTTGTIDHIAISDGSSQLLAVIQTSSLLVTAANTVQTPEIDLVLPDPT